MSHSHFIVNIGSLTLMEEMADVIDRHRLSGISGPEILGVLAHIAGSIIADAPEDMRDAVDQKFLRQLDDSIIQHLGPT